MKKDDHASENPRLFRLKNLVCFEKEGAGAEELKTADECGLKIYTFDEVLAIGEENMMAFEVNEPLPDDEMMFSYTSGTTGDPKGVKLTHKMLLMSALSVNMRMGKS
jgi:long-chain acyl-CoA synthetase